jgi:hypothetical protein
LGMNDLPQQPTGIPAPLGLIEPHAGLLSAPPDGQLLYKMMTVENLLRSVAGSYLHFNRVDAYQDLDPNDGAQSRGSKRARVGSAGGYLLRSAEELFDRLDEVAHSLELLGPVVI